MSLYHVSYELASSLSLPSPKRPKSSSPKLKKQKPLEKLRKEKNIEPELVEPTVNQTHSFTFHRQLSSLLSSRPSSAPPAISYPPGSESPSFSPFNPLAAPSALVLSTASIRSTTSSASARGVRPESYHSSQSSSHFTPRPVSRRQTWSNTVKRRTSRLSLDLSTFLEQTSSTCGTPTEEIEDFLVGGRENPNPYLYEADVIRGMGEQLELMSLSQIQNAATVDTVNSEKVQCQVHGVIVAKGRCSGCLKIKLEEGIREETKMRQRVQSSWLDLE
ncbi:hypothetical protein EV426DRAFT_704688 [Tirmania nivea]|nr:hypothetical protein EV426DRAFT_704688 [Tirmania nivea]